MLAAIAFPSPTHPVTPHSLCYKYIYVSNLSYFSLCICIILYYNTAELIYEYIHSVLQTFSCDPKNLFAVLFFHYPLCSFIIFFSICFVVCIFLFFIFISFLFFFAFLYLLYTHTFARLNRSISLPFNVCKLIFIYIFIWKHRENNNINNNGIVYPLVVTWRIISVEIVCLFFERVARKKERKKNGVYFICAAVYLHVSVWIVNGTSIWTHTTSNCVCRKKSCVNK